MKLTTIYYTLKNALFEPGSTIPLCLFRIAYGLVLLEYCVLMTPELLTCFSDTNGILRLQTLQHIFGIPVINLLSLLPPGDGWLIAFFAVFVCACLCVTVGLFTRVSIVIVYLGLVSFLHRNIYVHHSGDHLLCLAAFYMMFAPLGAELSLDRLWFGRHKPGAKPGKYSLWALKAFQLQFAIIYFQTSWAKIASPIWWDGTAMYYVLRQVEFIRFPLPIIDSNLILLKALTWSAVLIELCAWIFIWFKETRYLVLASLLALHLGIDYAMNIPIFEHIMIASLVIFIPAADAEKLVLMLDKGRRKLSHLFPLSAYRHVPQSHSSIRPSVSQASISTFREAEQSAFPFTNEVMDMLANQHAHIIAQANQQDDNGNIHANQRG
jgi:Vitamin K-dependent gamma-carboxylase